MLIAYGFVVWNAGLRRCCERLSHGVWILGVASILSVWIFGGLQVQGLFAVVFQFQLMALGCGLLILNGLFLDNVVTRFFAHPFWYPFARISYGTYLLHPYVLFWLIGSYAAFADPKAMGALGFLGFFVVVMLVTQLFAAASFLVVEQPLLNVAERVSAPRAPPSAGRDSQHLARVGVERLEHAQRPTAARRVVGQRRAAGALEQRLDQRQQGFQRAGRRRHQLAGDRTGRCAVARASAARGRAAVPRAAGRRARRASGRARAPPPATPP